MPCHETAVAIPIRSAPVFLLSGIGAMLAVLTNRLSRIIDRARLLETQLATSTPDAAASIHAELNPRAPRPAHQSGDHFVHRYSAAGVRRHRDTLRRRLWRV